jgi:single-stranded-DNA-specific exonuclease
VRELELLEPYGSGNPRPILCLSDVELEQAADVGNGKHLKLRVRCGGKLIDGIFFGHTVNELGLAGARRVDVAFTPQINEFRGRVSVQMMVCAVRVHSGRELASQLLTADRAALGVAGAYRPQRADFARLWRSEGSLCLGSDSSAILDACPPGMSEECYAICLAAMLESGLLESSDGSLCGAHRAQVEGKVDLPGTTVMRALEPKP